MKVTPIDVYEGLRVLEPGLEPGQKVVVKGVQLVRQGQLVKTETEPMDKYIKASTGIENVDQRFNSRITRVPGLDATPTPPGQTTAPPKADKPAAPPVEPSPTPKAGP